MVVLEENESALKRGAKIFAEIAGFGSSSSMNPVYEHIEPDGKAIELAIREAMDDAGIGADQIDLIIPCGLGLPQDDRAEATAIAAALGSAGCADPVLADQGYGQRHRCGGRGAGSDRGGDGDAGRQDRPGEELRPAVRGMQTEPVQSAAEMRDPLCVVLQLFVRRTDGGDGDAEQACRVTDERASRHYGNGNRLPARA